MLPPLLSVPSAPSNMFAEPREDAPSFPTKFTLLASADEGGHVVMAVGGTFPVQAQDLPGIRPIALQLSRDCRCLAVLGCTPSLEPSSAATSSVSSGSEGDLTVLILDVRKLAIRRRELSQCAALVERLAGVASYAQQAVDTLANVWRSAASTFSNKLKAFFDCLQAYSGGPDTDVHSELLFTLCTGNPSDALHAFLTRQTTPQQLSRIEKGLMQAIEYVNLVTCTRLQVAVQHLLAIIQDLKACSGTQRFKSIGLDNGLLCQLDTQTLSFASMTEHLLLDCSKARCFVRTLFQLLLFQAQKLTESTEGTPSNRPDSKAISSADIDDFVAAVRERRSLELEEVTRRIGKAQATDEESLVTQLATLTAAAEGLGTQLCAAMARHSHVLVEQRLRLAPPWQSLRPEHRPEVRPELARSGASPRGMARPVVHMAWEDREVKEDSDQALAETLPEQLRLFWCDGAEGGAQLCFARLRVEVRARGAPIQPELAMARLKADAAGAGHFLLCRGYDATRVAVLLQDAQQMTTRVCLLDLEAVPFRTDPPVMLTELTEQDAVRQSAPLPESYWCASAMRVMSQRGVCSVYSWRARRLLTLDMDADEDDMDDD